MGLEDEIDLSPPGPTAPDVEHSIKKAMEPTVICSWRPVWKPAGANTLWGIVLQLPGLPARL
jgi:hypothetical protein